MTLPRPVRLALTLALATLAGAACSALHTPLPWMIGPLLLTAALSLAGAPVQSSKRLRNAGQWAIGMALGLYFTPEVAARTVALAPWTLLGAAWSVLLGHLYFRWLLASQPAGSIDRATAYFSSVIGGASEMAQYAEQVGARVDRVAAAHSLRVMIVVVGIPFAYLFAEVHGHDATGASRLGHIDLGGLLQLMAGTAAAALLMRRLNQPNPWVLGPLLATLVISAAGWQPSALPGWLAPAAQLAVGVSLGSRFTPDFLHAAPRWLGAVALGTLGMIGLSAGFAWCVAQIADLDPAAVLLGTSPGGIAEMCITARSLELGVPLVTAFHIVRYLVVLMSTGPIWRHWISPEAGPSGLQD
ncbi:AbrB family transcriptional regulator [Sphaerotilus mobilis]|uniref:AbrB family transcriptional regulator n=1 Tax=Sphaerotilus mobilis TaxID=47994 RepID=A0A4Q7LVH0_9BURK|nr:AbrB family transcriptional regulator [Sphaerotilus mobilis]RZS58493.1 hypothetical protein EV685_0787 [Sphaerotilus mobilis]